MLDRVFVVSLDTGLLIFEAQYGSKSSVDPMKLSSLFYSITKLALSQPNRSSFGLDERNLIKIQKGNQSIFLCPFQKKNLAYSLITVFSRASDSFSKMFHFLFNQIYINLQESSLQVVDNKLKKQLKAIINKSIKESFQHYLSLLMNHSLLSNICCYGLQYQQSSSSHNQLSSNKPSSAPTITTDDSHNQNSNLSAPTTLPLEETRGRPSPTKHRNPDDKSDFTTDSTAFPLFFCCYSKLNKVHNCEDSAAPIASSVDEFESPIPKGTPFTLLHLHSSHNREDIRHLDQVLLPAINQNISNLFPNQTSNENESSLIYGEFLLNQHTGQFIIPDSKPTLLSEGDKAVGVFSYQNYAWIIQKETFSRREEIESIPFHDIITFILTLRLCHQQQLIAEIQ